MSKELVILRGEIKTPPIYRIDLDAIMIVDVFKKKTRETPHSVIEDCKRRLRCFDQMTGGGQK